MQNVLKGSILWTSRFYIRFYNVFGNEFFLVHWFFRSLICSFSHCDDSAVSRGKYLQVPNNCYKMLFLPVDI